MPIRVAIVGLGKIARDQHIPAIAASASFALVAAASHAGTHPGIPVFRDIDELLAADVAIDAVAMCQPPQARFEAASRAIRAGKHVMLEKPPGAGLSEVEGLVELAQAADATLFAAWHSRHSPGVDKASAWLAGRAIKRVAIVWKEDVRRWHPGQEWIWEPGGLGVFDPGINALSIATRILPRPLVLGSATLEVPANRAAPIAAELHMLEPGGSQVHALFDWRQEGAPTWDITVETDDGLLMLTDGGARLSIDGVERDVGREQEYPALYRRFAGLIAARRSEVDCAPLRLVADAFLRCRRVTVAPFED